MPRLSGMSSKCHQPNALHQMGTDAASGRTRTTSTGFGAPEWMKETLDLLNLEVTVEPDPLHGYGEIPIISFQNQIALGELGQEGLSTSYRKPPVV